MPRKKIATDYAWTGKWLALTLSLWSCGHGLIAHTTMVNAASCYFIGPTYQYNARVGYYDFNEVQKSQQVDRGSVNLFGVMTGKRYGLGKLARIQVGIGVDGGSKTDDTINIGMYDSTTINFLFIHAGLHPELHLYLPSFPQQRLRPFMTVGGGLNCLYLEERTFYKGMQIKFIDQPYVSGWRFSFNGSVGCGMDCSLSRDATIFVAYSFLYWQPVGYSVSWDLPLKSQPYHETFFTHKITSALLLDFK